MPFEDTASKAFQKSTACTFIDDYQQQGIGTALIKEAERIATAHDKTKIGIGVDLNPKDTPAQRLCPKLGYELDGRGPQPSPWGEVLFLTKPLTNSNPHDTTAA